jgi:hypothetical protein
MSQHKFDFGFWISDFGLVFELVRLTFDRFSGENTLIKNRASERGSKSKIQNPKSK